MEPTRSSTILPTGCPGWFRHAHRRITANPASYATPFTAFIVCGKRGPTLNRLTASRYRTIASQYSRRSSGRTLSVRSLTSRPHETRCPSTCPATCPAAGTSPAAVVPADADINANANVIGTKDGWNQCQIEPWSKTRLTGPSQADSFGLRTGRGQSAITETICTLKLSARQLFHIIISFARASFCYLCCKLLGWLVFLIFLPSFRKRGSGPLHTHWL